MGRDGKEIADTVIDLYNTVIGPMHHDLALQRNDVRFIIIIKAIIAVLHGKN